MSKEQLRAAQIMASYRMSREDVSEVMHILVNAGIEICLEEQQALIDEREALIGRATSGVIN